MAWEPVGTAAQVRELVRQRAGEGLHLDYKREFWTDNPNRNRLAREEAAKDVAAFANALGGTVLVGVAEDSEGRAGELIPLSDGESWKRTLDDWIGQQVDPREAAERVEVRVIAVEGGSVLAVNVPPWPGAPVVVGWSKTEGAMRFPVRRDRQTDFMTAAEVMARADASRRAVRLQLDGYLARSSRWDVVIGSRVGVRLVSASTALAAPPGKAHATLVA